MLIALLVLVVGFDLVCRRLAGFWGLPTLLRSLGLGGHVCVALVLWLVWCIS